MKMTMKELGGGKVLAGATHGKMVLTQMVGALPSDPTEPEPVFMDFSGVELATASFLRESAVAFRDIVRGRRSSFYPVVANANDLIRDELSALVAGRSDAILVCDLAESGNVSNIALIGELQPVQERTFKLVAEAGETDASEMMRRYGANEKTISPTAWNNRLTSLTFLGLLAEISRGRTKRYRLLFEGANYGL